MARACRSRAVADEVRAENGGRFARSEAGSREKSLRLLWNLGSPQPRQAFGATIVKKPQH